MSKALPRRRSRPSLATRMRAFWLIALVLVLAAAGGGWWLATLPAFSLHALSVSGLDRVARADVVRLAAIPSDRNVWLLNRDAIERRIETLPFVETARVHRRPPGDVWIAVVERTPSACLRDARGARVTIDRAERVLQTGCASSLPEFAMAGIANARPGAFVRSAELASLQDDVRTLAGAGVRVREAGRDRFGQLEATRFDGILVRFGDDGDLVAKARLIAPILAGLGGRVADVRALDLRAPATPVVQYRPPLPAAPRQKS